MKYWLVFAFLSTIFPPIAGRSLDTKEYDIIVYGGSSAGVVAAIQGSRMGKSVLLISQGNHLGGMMSNGLGWVDIGKPSTVGGLAKEYFHRVWSYYQDDTAWNWESKHPIKGQLMQDPQDETMYVVEPHVAELIFNTMLQETHVEVLYGERLNRKTGVHKTGPRIFQIDMESGRSLQGKIFIDATYEGDLMASAEISYTVERESNGQYGETLNGICINVKNDPSLKRIDPYQVKGNPLSGLLPRVFPNPQQKNGESDRGIQAYNYRMCLTDVPENRVSIEKPIGYDEREYELVFRAIEAGFSPLFFKFDLVPNRKADSNNIGMISTDFVGMNWKYSEADYSWREQMALAHEKWQMGLLWTLQNHDRVPAKIRNLYIPWGLPKDEFTDNHHWPYQLYVREARRMISSVVITEHTALNREAVQDPIALASYQMDSHATKYIVTSGGFLATEGGLYRSVTVPFPISYRAIISKKNECENLFVPICLSASHAAYGSVRMEPVLMMLAQSAATAASLAIDLQVTVQNVPYESLRQQLLKDEQVLY